MKVSEEELFLISGEKDIRKGMDVLVARHSLAMLLVTQGKEGVTAYWKNRFYHFPCQRVESVGTTGRGRLRGGVAGSTGSGYCTGSILWRIGHNSKRSNDSTTPST